MPSPAWDRRIPETLPGSTRVKQKILKAATGLRIRERTKYTKNHGKIKETLACVLLQLVEFIEIVHSLGSDRVNEDGTIEVFSRFLEVLCGLMRQPKPDVCLIVVRIEFEGTLELFDGTSKIAITHVSKPEIEIDFPEIVATFQCARQNIDHSFVVRSFAVENVRIAVGAEVQCVSLVGSLEKRLSPNGIARVLEKLSPTV